MRYCPDADGGVDGLRGKEGSFIACTFWLVDALVGTGRHDEARTQFERLLELRNDLGELSEEYDSTAERQLGTDQEKQAETAHDCDERCQSLAPPSGRVGRTGPRSPVRPSPPPQRPNLPFRPPMRS